MLGIDRGSKERQAVDAEVIHDASPTSTPPVSISRIYASKSGSMGDRHFSLAPITVAVILFSSAIRLRGGFVSFSRSIAMAARFAALRVNGSLARLPALATQRCRAPPGHPTSISHPMPRLFAPSIRMVQLLILAKVK